MLAENEAIRLGWQLQALRDEREVAKRNAEEANANEPFEFAIEIATYAFGGAITAFIFTFVWQGAFIGLVIGGIVSWWRTPRVKRNTANEASVRVAKLTAEIVVNEHRLENISAFSAFCDANPLWDWARLDPQPAENGRTDYQDYLQSPRWRELSREARVRAGNRCQLCNATGPNNVHHRSYERLGEGNEIDDLIVLCTECHKKFHEQGRIAAREQRSW